MASMLIFLPFFLLGFVHVSLGRPEQGLWVVNVDTTSNLKYFVKSMYKGSEVSVSVKCEAKDTTKMRVRWLLRRSPCAQEYFSRGMDANVMRYLETPEMGPWADMPYTETEMMSDAFVIDCTFNRQFYIHPYNATKPKVISFRKVNVTASAPKTKSGSKDTAPEKSKDEKETSSQPVKKEEAASKDTRKKRAAEENQEGTQKPAPTEKTEPAVTKEKAGSKSQPKAVLDKIDDQPFLKVWTDGYYLFVLRFENVGQELELPKEFKAEVTVRMKYDGSYIAAVDRPLLIFYGMMGLVYIGYGIFWLVMLACNWRDLLRVQFWVGGVIFLGMLEKAVFFGEYASINNSGQSVRGAIIFAELVSCLKRTLARMLVIIVSLGFGIVKPRLGQTLHKVLVVGVVYFVLASIEGCMRALNSKSEQSREELLAAVPLAITDAIICWWIFSSLLQTTRTLRLRRNVVKLSLYRHFTNTLIFAVLASIAYMIWFMTQHRFKDCVTDWKELWVDDAFWHLLFSVVLLIIMILWRPNTNNQRYAFSPLLDAAEDDVDDDQVLSEAYEGMKMRSTNTQQRNGSPRGFDAEQKVEDDLKWVEDNIPSSLADKVLPALDSDEEIMNTRFEVSKME